MPEPGDELGRAYRDLPREEPPASVDAAILAASRRAAGSRPEARPRRGFAARWGAPLSAVAVLVLGIAVALRMQVEQPGIETSLPQREAPAVIPKAIEATPPKEAAQPESRKVEPPRAPPPKPVPRERKQEAPMQAPAPAAAAPAAPAPAPASAPQVAAEMAAPAPQAQRAAPMSAATPMMKRSAAADMAGATANEMPTTPEAELERIARLRADGKDEEADRALEAFRKKYPDYRIAEAMWERVRRK